MAAVARSGGDGLSGRKGNIEYGNFTARVAREVGVALACIRGREKRAAIRAQELKRLSDICQKGRPSGDEARSAVLGVISTVLPGCRAYIGVLQSGGHTLRYESATPNSAMKGRELRRGEGISFHYLDDPDGQINVVQYRDHAASGTGTVAPEPPSLQATAKVDGPKPPNFSVGDAVEVWYASSWLPAKVVRAWGHQCFDVRYEEFRETEAGVPGWRLRQVVTLEHLKVKVCWEGSSEEIDGADGTTDDTHGVSHCSGRNSEAWPWPFVCAPLRSAGNRVGVLGVDGWSGVELGRPEEVHPEKAVVNFLREVGSLLADALYTERRNKGLSALGKTLRGHDTTQNGALETLIMLLRETVTFRTRIDVLETRAAEPGAMYCRGTWESTPYDEGKQQGRNVRQWQSPARVFDVSLAPRVEELCITPAQFKRLGNQNHRGGIARGGPLSPQTQKQQSLLLKEIDPYQREMHLIARDGPGATSGLQARALSTPSRRGEVVGRFQRLLVRAGGGRPSADGWFLVRVARALPEDSPREPYEKRKKNLRPKNAAAARTENAANSSAASSEEGDIWLLSEMCRKLDVGFMAIASRQQRAAVRLKAMDRVLNCCKGFNAAAVAPPPTETEYTVTDLQPGGRKTRPATKSTSRANGEDKNIKKRHATAPDAAGGPDAKGITSGGSQLRPKVSAARKGGGNSTTRTNATGGALTSAKGSSSSPLSSAAAAVGNPPSSTPAASAVASKSLSPKASAPKELFGSTTSVGSNALGAVEERERTSASKTDIELTFSTPVQRPTPAETSDGRKGALVTLKDSRLAVLVYQGDRRVAVVEQPGGKQQTVPESEVSQFR